ncbi:MAG: NAD(+) diphosphatase [Candidatus Weimeria sp.]
MIQDIFPDKLYNQYDAKAVPSEDSPVYIFRGDSLLINKEGGFLLPSYSDLGEYLSENEGAKVIFLFRINEEKRFLLLPPLSGENQSFMSSHVDGDNKPFPSPSEGGVHFSYRKIFDIRMSGLCPKTELFAITTAFHLNVWYGSNRFCGRCAAPLQLAEKERALVCPHCKNTIYPRINPAVIVAVTDHDRILLTKYRGRADVPFYALIAGFVEIGETLEETVQREVMEEAGLRVKNIRYYKSQPWGKASDILSGFFCDVDGSTEITMEEDELSVAEWCDRDQVIGQPDDMSLTNEMMMLFRDGREPQSASVSRS